jgi:hypothetical protein
MPKINLNLIGDSFSHLTGGNKGYSVHGKVSKYVNWERDNTIGISFYIDDNLDKAFDDNVKGIKYGWLLESKFVIPSIMQKVKENYQQYFQVFRYIFTNDKELLDLDDRFKWCPSGGFWIKKPKIYPKSKMISFITSKKCFTPGHIVRLEWVDKIGNQVDLYGRGFSEIETKEDGLCDYMFSIAIENGFYKSFFSEKILDCFATGTIPVYLGTEDIGDYFNKDGIINLVDNLEVSAEIYYDKVEAIKDNLQRVKKFEVLEDFIYENYDII